MSMKEKHVLSSLIGKPSVGYIKEVIFGQIDDALLTFSAGADERLLRDALFATDTSLGYQILSAFSLSGISDPILSITGHYFIIENNQIIKNDYNNHPFSFFEVSVEDRVENGINNNFVSYKNNISIAINHSNFKRFFKRFFPKTDQLYTSLGGSGELALALINYAFMVCLKYYISLNTNSNPYASYETQMYDDKKETNLSSYYDIKSNYNFYIKNYEDTFNKSFQYENIIPNYYSLEDYLINNNSSTQNHLGLTQRVDISKQSLASQEYYSKFAEVVEQNKSNTEFLRSHSSQLRSILLDSEYVVTQTKQLSTELLPCVNEIIFSNTDLENDIFSFLQDQNLDMLTTNNIYGLLYGPEIRESRFTIQSIIKDNLNNANGKYTDLYGNKYDTILSNIIKTENTQYASYSGIYEFIDSINDVGFYTNPIKIFKFGQQNFEEFKGQENIFLYIKLQSLVEFQYNKYIDFNKIYNLETLETNSLSYFIEKKETDDYLKQIIGLSKNMNLPYYSYIDSQVIYDKEIKYDAYSIDLVPQTNHSYEPKLNLTELTITDNNGLPPSSADGGFIPSSTLSLSCITSLSIRAYKNHLFTKNVKISDNPPLPPQVKFIPYINVNNVIGMWFNNSFGSYEQEPVIMLSTDTDIFNNVIVNQNLNNGKVFFESNDLVKEIQLFYARIKPTSYSDFSTSNLISLQLNEATSLETNLSINSNTKYYFTFRSVDVHNLISNPSSVFEVELVDNDGAIYSIINIIDLEMKKDYDTFKSFRKYLHIKPSFEYLQIVPMNEELTEAQLGLKQDLWGKKYKIRVTSKKSGKSFDINIKLNKEEKDLT